MSCDEIKIMSVEKTEIETFFGTCRCCLSYGYLKNMWTEHRFEGDAEVYGEMLVQCFALTWEHTEDSIEQDQICEQCICRLRDAHDFKRVVLNSQEDLMQQIDAENEHKLTVKEEQSYENFHDDYVQDEDTAATIYDDTENTMDTMPSVKDETQYEEIEYLEDEIEYLEVGGTHDTAIYTDSSQITDQLKSEKIPIKRRKHTSEPTPDDDIIPIKRKWPKKLPKSERHKTYKQYSEVDLRKCIEEVRNNVLSAGEAALKYDIPKKTICAKIKVDPNDAQRNIKATENEANAKEKSNVSTPKDPKTKCTIETEDDQHISRLQKGKDLVAHFKATVRSILKFTNATPIRGYWGIGYACTYCAYQTGQTSELKRHTLETHSENDNELENLKYVADMIIRLDITALKCQICDSKLNSLYGIMNHIKLIHKAPMYLDISNHIVPFKFGKDDLTCALCPSQFNHYKHLSEHMSEHFPNYACKQCNRCFINQRALRMHTLRHLTGTFVCSFCPKIFDTQIKMREHERVLHLKSSKVRKCGYCDERFVDPVLKSKHEVKKHGAPVSKYVCKECGKCFKSQRAVKGHLNQFHLKLRPHTCSECGKGFYNKQQLKRHSVKHTKAKEFQCAICSKFYTSKSSLKCHLKIHENEKSYSCENCGETFVQRIVWVHHVTHQECKFKSNSPKTFVLLNGYNTSKLQGAI